MPHWSVFHLCILIVSEEEYKWLSSSSCNFLQPPVTPCPSYITILSMAHHSHTSSVYTLSSMWEMSFTTTQNDNTLYKTKLHVLFVCFLQDTTELIKMPVGLFTLQSTSELCKVLDFKQSCCFWYCLTNFQVCLSIQIWCLDITECLWLTVKIWYH